MRAHCALLLLVAASACTQPGGPPPSLAPRPAEAIDPRVPIESSVPAAPVDAALAARLTEIVAEARAGDEAFRQAAVTAERLAAAAGSPRSESWVVAQQALSSAVAARAPTTRALADLDALAATAIATQGGIAPANFAAIQSASAEVGRIDREQAERIEALQARLTG